MLTFHHAPRLNPPDSCYKAGEMSVNRVFFPQEVLDRWLDKGRVTMNGSVATLEPDQQRLKLIPAVHFVNELTDSGDVRSLLGRVKDINQLAELDGEHFGDSVVIGDEAYEVIEGFVGAPLGLSRAESEHPDHVSARPLTSKRLSIIFEST